jgi:membrane-associated protease RseP (regulator of RpoE activity)
MSDQRPPSNPWVELWKTTVSGVVKLCFIGATAGVIFTGLAFMNGGAHIDYNGLSIDLPARDVAMESPAPELAPVAPPTPVLIEAPAAPLPPAPPEPTEVTPIARLDIPFLGIRYGEDSRLVTDGGRMTMIHGAVVHDVLSGTPAESVGLQARDLITAVDDRQLRHFTDLAEAIREAGVGTVITLEVHRDDRAMQIPVKLARLAVTPE